MIRSWQPAGCCEPACTMACGSMCACHAWRDTGMDGLCVVCTTVSVSCRGPAAHKALLHGGSAPYRMRWRGNMVMWLAGLALHAQCCCMCLPAHCPWQLMPHVTSHPRAVVHAFGIVGHRCTCTPAYRSPAAVTNMPTTFHEQHAFTPLNHSTVRPPAQLRTMHASMQART